VSDYNIRYCRCIIVTTCHEWRHWWTPSNSNTIRNWYRPSLMQVLFYTCTVLAVLMFLNKILVIRFLCLYRTWMESKWWHCHAPGYCWRSVSYSVICYRAVLFNYVIIASTPWAIKKSQIIMAALRRICGHYIFALWLLLLLSFFPCLISAVGDWMSTILPHMVWP